MDQEWQVGQPKMMIRFQKNSFVIKTKSLENKLQKYENM